MERLRIYVIEFAQKIPYIKGTKGERVHARVHSFTPAFDPFRSLTAHGAHTLATIRKLPSGNCRVQVRRKGQYVNETFRRFKEAEEWTLHAERRMDRGRDAHFPVKG